MGYLTSLWLKSGGHLCKVEKKILNKKIPSLIVNADVNIRIRLFIIELIMNLSGSDMLHPSLKPPESVQGMTVLRKETFKKTVKVPGIKLPKKDISRMQKTWKPLLLKLRRLKPVACLDDKDPLKNTHNLILLDPSKLENKEENNGCLERLHKLGFSPESVEKFELDVGYDNWSLSEVMKAILPQDADNISSFTQIGHIAHVNLKEENLPFKHLIGEVILDKIPSVKTVVNKLNSIDNTYRNFQMELLAGENDYVTQTREHNCVFELDFSKVYWNSRLSTEHQRIVDIIPKASVVYDIFAGVGPFTVPLGKRKNCTIFANDLNPHSFKSLEKNVKLNKLKEGSVQTFNLDGRDFIRTIVKRDLSKRIKASYLKHFKRNVTDLGYKDNEFSENILENADTSTSSLESEKHELCLSTFAIMNLPALAVDFLDAFVSLLSDLPVEFQEPEVLDPVLPIIYCYAFCGKKDDIDAEVKKRAEIVLNRSLPSDTIVRIVRNVSPNKEMVCLIFKLSSDVVLAVERNYPEKDSGQDTAEPDNKRIKLS